MKPSHHVIVSAGISLGFQATMHSWPATLGCFLSGVLIDTDHHLDYLLINKKIPFNYKDLLDFCEDAKVTKTYLLFHAYEFLFVFWLLIYFLSLGKLWIGIAIGLTTHMLFDQFINPVKPLFYFITFRIANQFEKTKLLTERYFQH